MVPSAAEIADQLRTAGTAWSTVRGRTRWWRRQDLVTAAFTAAYDAQVDAGLAVSTLSATRPRTADDPATDEPATDEPGDDIIESTVEVAVQRVPWRLRAELLTAHGVQARTEVLVVDGSTFWARRAGAATITNGGDPDVGHGGGEIAELLDPAAVPDLFDLAVTGAERVAGRACTAVTATRRPGPGPHGSWPDPPFAMISGGTRFTLSVDADLGILLRVVKVVDGADAEVTEFTTLTVDGVLPDTLFAPLPNAQRRP